LTRIIELATQHAAVRIAAASRPHQEGTPDFVNQWVNWGAGLRAAQFLVLGAKAKALLAGRAHVAPDGVPRFSVNAAGNGSPVAVDVTLPSVADGAPALAATGSAKYLEGFGPPMDGFDQVQLGDLDAVRKAIGPYSAGILIEPPPSVPSAIDVRPAETEAPAPPLDPPAERSSAHGLPT